MFNPFRVVTMEGTLPKVGPLGIGPTVGLNDSIPLGLVVSIKRKWLISRVFIEEKHEGVKNRSHRKDEERLGLRLWGM